LIIIILVNLNNFIADFAIGVFTSNFLINFLQKNANIFPYFIIIIIIINYKIVLYINFLQMGIIVVINVEFKFIVFICISNQYNIIILKKKKNPIIPKRILL